MNPNNNTTMTGNQRENHLFSTVRFFKIILYRTIQAGKLKIPNKFTIIYGDNLPNPIFLKTPDGIAWEIDWTKHDDDGGIWLQKGWKELAAYYALRQGHLVTFDYNGTCYLDVHIYDLSGLEIMYPIHNIHNPNEINDHSEGPRIRQTRKRLRTCSSEDHGQSSNLPQHVQISGPQTPKKLRTLSRRVVGKSSSLPLQVKTEDDLSQGPRPCKKLRKRSRVIRKSSKLPERAQIASDQSQEDGCGAIESLNRAAAASTSKAPSFTVILKRTYVTGFSLIVPLVFIKEHLKENEGEDFLLRVLDGRSWQVHFRNGRFRTGWSKFTSDNHLNVGDVCLFEFTKNQMSFDVTIIRVQGDGDLQRIPKLKCIADVPIQAMQKAETFKSRHPFFKVILKANQMGDYRPRVPVAFMRKYFAEKHIVILRHANKSWDVELIGRVQTKLSKGWVQFAKEINLQVGDVCAFELIDEVGPVFDVHIFRDQSLVLR